MDVSGRQRLVQVQQNQQDTGGESGIRTHVTLSSKHAFQACAFSHSAISPGDCDSFVILWGYGKDRNSSNQHSVVS